MYRKQGFDGLFLFNHSSITSNRFFVGFVPPCSSVSAVVILYRASGTTSLASSDLWLSLPLKSTADTA